MINQDWQKLLEQVQKMQAQVQAAQQALKHTTVTGTAGAGLVKIHLTGDREVKAIELDEALLTEPKAVIEELIAAGMRDALKQVEGHAKKDFSSLSQLFNLFNPTP